MKRAYFALTAGKHTWIITLQEQIEEFLSEQYFACKSWIKFLPNLVLMTLNNLSSRKLKSVFALWCIRLPILIYDSHFLYFLCGLFTSVCVICVYILQSRIFALLKTHEQKVQFSFALSLLICCPSSQAPLFSEGKKTELLLLFHFPYKDY